MLRALLIARLRTAWSTWSVRGCALAVLTVLAVAWATAEPQRPAAIVGRLAWAQLLQSLVVGACFIGWRVAQLPKSRAAEFQLVTPASDWGIVGGEVGGGVLRALLVNAATLPVIAGLCGAGWIGPAAALTLIVVPTAGGWVAGTILAALSYEPAWVRRLLERLVLACILAYLVLFGLLGTYTLPWYVELRARWQGTLDERLIGLQAWLSYLNPFALLEEVPRTGGAALAQRTLAVALLLALVALACTWRMVRRLRTHYLAENYGRQFDKQDYARRVGANPLSWWTARRVSRFKGRVNLYLMWTTIGLYGGWLMFESRWPSWLAVEHMYLIRRYGGEAMLGAAAMHLALVPAMFLSGLWDSNPQQRVGRLELLLVTPLRPKHYLWASVVAGWTRGRGYVLGALAMWLAAVASGRLPANASLWLTLVGANYALLCFAAAFRNFARLEDDRAASSWGLAWSVGVPLVTVGLFAAGQAQLAAATPLGALYLLALPAAEQAQATGLAAWQLAVIILASGTVYLGISLWLLRSALVHFDREIRAWFAGHLVSERVKQAAHSGEHKRSEVPVASGSAMHPA